MASDSVIISIEMHYQRLVISRHTGANSDLLKGGSFLLIAYHTAHAVIENSYISQQEENKQQSYKLSSPLYAHKTAK